jgi:FkbM family methyltransferase
LQRLRYLYRALDYRFRKARREIAYLREHIRPGDTVVDVGAHKGGFLYWLRAFATSAGRVYAFEPQPALARYLERIVALQGWQNVVVAEAGVSSRPGSMELFVPVPEGATSPGATLSPADRGVPHHSVRVPVVTLDAFLEERGDPRVACIKCDSEGHELEVFKGAEGCLRRHRPLLLFECEQRHLPGSSPAAVFDYLRALGYRGFFFGPAGLAPVEAFRPEIHQAVRPGRYWDARDYFNNFAFTAEA